MAVYQGARPRPRLLPDARPIVARDRTALPRRSVRSAARARRGSSRIGFVLGGIVLAFLLAFFSLAQTVSVSATSYSINRLGVERERLDSARRDLDSDLNRLGREPAIRKQAVEAGLVPLGAPLVIPVR